MQIGLIKIAVILLNTIIFYGIDNGRLLSWQPIDAARNA